jgi:hypothetical protein
MLNSNSFSFDFVFTCLQALVQTVTSFLVKRTGQFPLLQSVPFNFNVP